MLTTGRVPGTGINYESVRLNLNFCQSSNTDSNSTRNRWDIPVYTAQINTDWQGKTIVFVHHYNRYIHKYICMRYECRHIDNVMTLRTMEIIHILMYIHNGKILHHVYTGTWSFIARH